jgi:hypothetical protein
MTLVKMKHPSNNYHTALYPSTIRELADLNPEAVILEPREQFNKAYVGYVTSVGIEARAVYDVQLIIDALMKHDNMEEMDAWEHYSFNIEGLGVPHAPVFLYKEYK